MTSLQNISPFLMSAAIALSAATVMAKEVTPSTPMPTLPPMPMPTPSVTPMPMPMPTPALSTETEKPAPKSEVPQTEAATKQATNTIVDVASEAGTFKTLVAALKAADLVETLSSPGPFTVFAPTDAAFAALPKGTVEKLLKPENKEKLVKILTYHVVPGSVASKTLKSGKVKTVEGSSLMVTVSKRNVTIDKATVKTADIKASNGLIHVIDQVIVPADL